MKAGDLKQWLQQGDGILKVSESCNLTRTLCIAGAKGAVQRTGAAHLAGHLADAVHGDRRKAGAGSAR